MRFKVTIKILLTSINNLRYLHSIEIVYWTSILRMYKTLQSYQNIFLQLQSTSDFPFDNNTALIYNPQYFFHTAHHIDYVIRHSGHNVILHRMLSPASPIFQNDDVSTLNLAFSTFGGLAWPWPPAHAATGGHQRCRLYLALKVGRFFRGLSLPRRPEISRLKHRR